MDITTRKIPFHFKYHIKKVDGYGSVRPKVGLVLTEIFSPIEELEQIQKPISYVITDVKKESFTMSCLLGYDKKLAIIDDTGGVEVILVKGKWRRRVEINSYFVFGISSGISPYKDRNLIRNGSFG